MFVTWLIVLIAGRMPRSLHEALAAAVRYQARVTGYFLMLTARYPGGLFGDPETAPSGRCPGGTAGPGNGMAGLGAWVSCRAGRGATEAPGAPRGPAGPDQPGYGTGRHRTGRPGPVRLREPGLAPGPGQPDARRRADPYRLGTAPAGARLAGG